MKVTDTSLNTYTTSYLDGGTDSVQHKRTAGAEGSPLPPTLPLAGATDGQIGNDGQVALPPPDNGPGSADQKAQDSLMQSLDTALNNIGFDVVELMKVMYLMAKTERDSAKVERRAETDLQAKAMDEQAQKQRDQADEAMAGAAVYAAAQIAGGAASVAGGAAGLGKIKTANAAANQKVAPMEKMQQIEKGAAGVTPAGAGKAPSTVEIEQIRQGVFTQETKPVDMWLQVFQGGSQALQGAGGIAKGHFDREAGYLDAEKTGKEKEAMLHQAARDIANDRVQQAADWMRSQREALAAIFEKQYNVNISIGNNIKA